MEKRKRVDLQLTKAQENRELVLVFLLWEVATELRGV